MPFAFSPSALVPQSGHFTDLATVWGNGRIEGSGAMESERSERSSVRRGIAGSHKAAWSIAYHRESVLHHIGSTSQTHDLRSELRNEIVPPDALSLNLDRSESLLDARSFLRWVNEATEPFDVLPRVGVDHEYAPRPRVFLPRPIAEPLAALVHILGGDGLELRAFGVHPITCGVLRSGERSLSASALPLPERGDRNIIVMVEPREIESAVRFLDGVAFERGQASVKPLRRNLRGDRVDDALRKMRRE
jgi:hypothetical protein